MRYRVADKMLFYMCSSGNHTCMRRLEWGIDLEKDIRCIISISIMILQTFSVSSNLNNVIWIIEIAQCIWSPVLVSNISLFYCCDVRLVCPILRCTHDVLRLSGRLTSSYPMYTEEYTACLAYIFEFNSSVTCMACFICGHTLFNRNDFLDDRNKTWTRLYGVMTKSK